MSVVKSTLTQPKTQLAELKFLPNYRRSSVVRYISTHQGCLVFADKQLDAKIRQQRLRGKTIRVHLSEIDNQRTDTCLFQAHQPRNRFGLGPEVIQRPDIRQLSTVFLVDCQNMIGSLRQLRAHRNLYQIIQRVQALLKLPPQQINCYACEDEYETDYVRQLRMHRRELKIILTPRKEFQSQRHDHRQYKRDVDPYLTPEIVRQAFCPDPPDCLVVFGGDSDLCESLKMWMGLPGFNPYPIQHQRPLILVSSHQSKSLSVELKELANSPWVELILIEDLLRKNRQL